MFRFLIFVLSLYFIFMFLHFNYFVNLVLFSKIQKQNPPLFLFTCIYIFFILFL
ncbi:hypothetical protein RchiOBHm_Chr0c31g0501411 [Rosa chinensis]|uniref:Uncharacterized protein n=1 Tax=Rosa chinensis TaxID=74649 RepID=A0A2P6SQA0_ROSCH|nr:hypothetical protein RchiOBHm_Chr0c31g0501411 [Rosa chinensis]